MKSIQAILLFALLLGNSVVLGADLNARCMASYQKLERHICGQCHLNVLDLLEQFPAGTDLKNTQVLYLKPPWVRRLKTFPKNEGWIFHVVVQRNGKILDPDFSTDSALDIHQYLKTMYKIDEIPNNDFEIIAIPAEDYLAEMGKIDSNNFIVDHNYYLNKEGYSRYPKVQASEVLRGREIPKPSANFRPNPSMPRLLEDSRNIEWRDGDWLVRMAEGKITAFHRGKETADLERIKIFFTELENRSRQHERFRRALQHFWSMGGRRP